MPETDYTDDVDELADGRIRMRLRGEERMTDPGVHVTRDTHVSYNKRWSPPPTPPPHPNCSAGRTCCEPHPAGGCAHCVLIGDPCN